MLRKRPLPVVGKVVAMVPLGSLWVVSWRIQAAGQSEQAADGSTLCTL